MCHKLQLHGQLIWVLLSRYGLQPGDDSDDDEARGDQSAVEQQASNLQGLAVSGIEALAYRLFR